MDAQRWLDEVTTAIRTDLYADPKAGKVTLSSYYQGWSSRQVWVRRTRQSFDPAVRTDSIKELPIWSIRTSQIEAWVHQQVSDGWRTPRPGGTAARQVQPVPRVRGPMRVRRAAEGEAAGVQVGDIYFLRRRLTVSRQLQRSDDGQMVAVPPKYGRSGCSTCPRA